MPTVKMHADEVDTSVELVRNLLAEQFPQWADLSIEPAIVTGTDNAIFRLGDRMLVRLPRIEWAMEQVDKEQACLPKLANLLPLIIPSPIAKGLPGGGYPWNWSIYDWVDGETASSWEMLDNPETAIKLAGFITALHLIDASDGPRPGSHNSGRGQPLAERNDWTLNAIERLDSLVDADLMLALWNEALQIPTWQSQSVWVHGDLQPGNLLFHNGQLSAVIDFGCLGVGDPAVDLMIAWSTFSPETRSIFRQALKADDDTWARGRAWALSVALVALPYYLDRNKTLAEQSRQTINAIIAEFNAQ